MPQRLCEPMKNLYHDILQSKTAGKKLLAILLDPDKIELGNIRTFCKKIMDSPATHVFVGGSTVEGSIVDAQILELKKHIHLPILLFPGHPSQISAEADGILFLMLLSGRNAEYLIEHQIQAVPLLEKTNLEIISTGYILIESGAETAVEKVSQTKPLSRNNSAYAAQTAKAGEFIGNKLIYLEAGSGAQLPVPLAMIECVSKAISVPLIVGGGIRSQQQINEAYQAGADIVVIGTAFENDLNFFIT